MTPFEKTQQLESIRNRQAVNRMAIDATAKDMRSLDSSSAAWHALYDFIVERDAENRALDEQAAELLKR